MGSRCSRIRTASSSCLARSWRSRSGWRTQARPSRTGCPPRCGRISTGRSTAPSADGEREGERRRTKRLRTCCYGGRSLLGCIVAVVVAAVAVVGAPPASDSSRPPFGRSSLLLLLRDNHPIAVAVAPDTSGRPLLPRLPPLAPWSSYDACLLLLLLHYPEGPLRLLRMHSTSPPPLIAAPLLLLKCLLFLHLNRWMQRNNDIISPHNVCSVAPEKQFLSLVNLKRSSELKGGGGGERG